MVSEGGAVATATADTEAATVGLDRETRVPLGRPEEQRGRDRNRAGQQQQGGSGWEERRWTASPSKAGVEEGPTLAGEEEGGEEAS